MKTDNLDTGHTNNADKPYDDGEPWRMIFTLLLVVIIFAAPFAAWLTGRDLPVPL